MISLFTSNVIQRSAKNLKGDILIKNGKTVKYKRKDFSKNFLPEILDPPASIIKHLRINLPEGSDTEEAKRN